MLDKIAVEGTTFKMYLTMSRGEGKTPSMRYNKAVQAAMISALNEWSELCYTGDCRICLKNEDIVNNERACIDDGCAVMMRLEKSTDDYKYIGCVNIPSKKIREIKTI